MSNRSKGSNSSKGTNSSLVTYTNITNNKSSPRNHKIDRITIHCIVGQWTAKQGCDYFKNTDRKCSANYVVGRDGSIGLSVDEADRSWCSSSSANDNRAVTIETASDTTHPYAVTDEAYEALIKLVADICSRNGISKLIWFGDKNKSLSYEPKDGEAVMTVHRWFANKSCPGDYLYSKHGEIADRVNKILGNSNKSSESSEVNDMIYKVQVGAYKNKANAEAMLTKLKAAGFDGFIVGGNINDKANASTKVQANASTKVQANASTKVSAKKTDPVPVKKSNEEIATEVIQGKWGNGTDRKNRLTKAGYNYSVIQSIVNKKLS